MAEKDTKPTEQTRSPEQRKLDDFWDVERLLPERPLRKAPLPRSTPAAVDVELPARPKTPADGISASAAPVSATPLTVTSRGGREASPSSDSRSPAEEYSRPMPAPRAHPAPRTNPVGQAEGTHYVPPHKAEEPTLGQPLLEYAPDGALLHRVRVYGWQANYHYFDSFIEDA